LWVLAHTSGPLNIPLLWLAELGRGHPADRDNHIRPWSLNDMKTIGSMLCSMTNLTMPWFGQLCVLNAFEMISWNS
jgi:hypothetical protein